MFKLTNTIDIASEMESNLYKATHEEESHVERKRIEAAHQLSVAATAFEQAGLYKFAEASTILVERVLNANSEIEKEAAKKDKKPVGKKVKKPKNPGKSKDEKEMYRYIGYDANDIEDSPHGNAGPKGLYYGNAHLPGVYHKTHEGPGELEREELESRLRDVPDIQGDSSGEELEDKFLDMILGGEQEMPETEEEIEQIAENNDADDLNMINELFEDV